MTGINDLRNAQSAVGDSPAILVDNPVVGNTNRGPSRGKARKFGVGAINTLATNTDLAKEKRTARRLAGTIASPASAVGDTLGSSSVPLS